MDISLATKLSNVESDEYKKYITTKLKEFESAENISKKETTNKDETFLKMLEIQKMLS